MSANLKHFDKAGFELALGDAAPVIVDFWATWCGPCRMIAPAIEAVAEEFAGKVVVGKVDVDNEPELAARYGVMSIPTVILFKNGQEVKRLTGAMPQQVYADMAEGAL